MAFKEKYLSVKSERTKFIAALNPKSFDFQIATWFGSGLIIPAPGTWGTVGGMLFGIPLLLMTNQWVVLGAAIVLFIMGLWSVHRLEKQLHDHDPSFIVIDEAAAILLGISALIGTTFQEIWLEAALLFIFFRIFDAWKPWPISWADRKIRGALGVMLDDILAVIIAIITYKILLILVMLTIIPDYYGVDF